MLTLGSLPLMLSRQNISNIGQHRNKSVISEEIFFIIIEAIIDKFCYKFVETNIVFMIFLLLIKIL